ncbi:MAG: hypothetical protein Fur0037_14540 [Planctomycetota bacterium]
MARLRAPSKFAPMRRTARLVLFCLLGSCALARQESNDPIDARIVRTLEPGRTTAREVVERLGAPTDVVQLGRRTAYRYDASITKSAALFLILFNMGAQDTRTDRLWVFFDENDVLTHYGASYGTHRAQYALPWEDVHEPEDDAARDAGRAGLSAR